MGVTTMLDEYATEAAERRLLWQVMDWATTRHDRAELDEILASSTARTVVAVPLQQLRRLCRPSTEPRC